MIDTAHFLFHKVLKKKRILNQTTTPKDAPVWYIIMYYLHRIVIVMRGHDDFSIIYVRADICAHDDNVSPKTLYRTAAENFASLTSHIIIITTIYYVCCTLYWFTGSRARTNAAVSIFNQKINNNNSKNMYNNGLCGSAVLVSKNNNW